jgi:hypothetical protein
VVVSEPRDGFNSTIVFIFRNGSPEPEQRHTSLACKQAFDRYKRGSDQCVETEIVVSPRKGNHKNPVTHKLAHLEKAHPDWSFIAVVDESDFRQMCRDADTDWKKTKAAQREIIDSLAHSTNRARLDDLPADIRARIKEHDNGCWHWVSLLCRETKGKKQIYRHVFIKKYGRIRYKGRAWRSHKLTYTLLVGEVPKGIYLCHQCDTPACVNPSHLQLGIAEDNFQDMIERNRAAWQIRRSRQ